jgi:hypothetical protein
MLTRAHAQLVADDERIDAFFRDHICRKEEMCVACSSQKLIGFLELQPSLSRIGSGTGP